MFELPVIAKGYSSENTPFLEVYHAENDRKFRVFNLLKCQEEETPEKLYVKVAYVDVLERVKMKQDKERVYRDHYTINDSYEFKVTGEGTRDGRHYFEVEDELDKHSVLRDEGAYRIDELVRLVVDDITPNGYLKLRVPKRPRIFVSKLSMAPNDATNVVLPPTSGISILDVEDESQTLELKSSLVFTPNGVNSVNVDDQVSRIIRTLTAFMNRDGGTLYIGVHDKTKAILGIEEDYRHLNEGEEDDYTYSPNRDGYQLKIRNEIARLCTAHAGELVKSITFENKEGKEYCKIEVEKAKRPVWFKGSQLFIREGNRNHRLVNDELTLFIFDKLKSDLADFLNPAANIPENLPQPAPKGTTDYKILWFDDRTWVRTKNEERYGKPEFIVEVPQKPGDLLLVFCYESGSVNVMKLSEFRAGVNLNKVQNNGWYEGEKPLAIFLMDPSDLLVGYCIDENGHQTVKAHAITDFGKTKAPKNQGSRFAPQVHHVRLYATLSATHKNQIPDLIVPKAQKTTNSGIPLSSVPYQDQISQLHHLLTK